MSGNKSKLWDKIVEQQKKNESLALKKHFSQKMKNAIYFKTDLPRNLYMDATDSYRSRTKPEPKKTKKRRHTTGLTKPIEFNSELDKIAKKRNKAKKLKRKNKIKTLLVKGSQTIKPETKKVSKDFLGLKQLKRKVIISSTHSERRSSNIKTADLRNSISIDASTEETVPAAPFVVGKKNIIDKNKSLINEKQTVIDEAKKLINEAKRIIEQDRKRMLGHSQSRRTKERIEKKVEKKQTEKNVKDAVEVNQSVVVERKLKKTVPKPFKFSTKERIKKKKKNKKKTIVIPAPPFHRHFEDEDKEAIKAKNFIDNFLNEKVHKVSPKQNKKKNKKVKHKKKNIRYRDEFDEDEAKSCDRTDSYEVLRVKRQLFHFDVNDSEVMKMKDFLKHSGGEEGSKSDLNTTTSPIQMDTTQDADHSDEENTHDSKF